MRSMKILFVLLLLFGHFGIILSPGEDVEPLYSSLMGACKTNIRFAGSTSYLSPPSAVGSVLGFLLLLLFSTGAKVRKKNANCSRIADAIRVCWPKLLSTYTCKYGAKGSAAQLQVTVIMPSWQYVAAQLPLIKDSYSAAAALTIAFGDTCGYQHSPRALVKSPTAAVLQVSQGSLQRFWVFASSIVVPVYRTCIICLQRLCKLAASPSASSMLRLLTALRWLLIVAGDVELNPGPIPADFMASKNYENALAKGDGGVAGIAELLPTVDHSVLNEDNLFYVLEEMGSLAGRWRNMCLALGVPDVDTIASRWRDYPKDCLTDVLKQWLKKSYNTQMHGPPTWRKLVGAVANNNGGDNPALAEAIAKNHQCIDPGAHAQPDQCAQLDPRVQSTGTDPHAQPANAIDLYAKYLRGKYKTGISKFLSLQWPPPPTRKVLKLAMILEENIRYGSSDEIIRHTQHGRINDVLYKKKSVKVEEIFQLDTAERKVILIEGAPGSGKSTLAWHICKQWQSGDLFQEFHTVVFVQLRDPAIHSATSVEHILPATSWIQTAAVVAELQAIGGRGMLWVLDGWDELPSHLRTDSILHHLIEDPAKLDLNSSTILITSRPVASGDLYHSITSRIEILGFTPTEVKEYFTEALKGDVRSVEILQNYLKEQPIIEASCYVPFNAVIVTHLFKAQNQSLPTTLHGIFTLLVIGCLIRHMKKQSKECRISSLDGLPSCLKEPFQKICTLAYHHVMKNKATFSAEDLEQLGLPQKLDTLGLIQGVESFTSLQKSVSYNFLHLSVQELLASFYISKLPESEQIEIFKVLFGQPRFAAVFRFYAAFTKLKTAGIREIVANIVKKEKKTELLYLIHGLYEAQDVSLCQFVISQLSGQLNLRSNSLSPLDCLSIGYFLCCICHTTEGTLEVDLSWCSLDHNRVRFLMKEFSKCSSESKTTVTDARVTSCTELHLNLWRNAVGDDGAALLCAALNGNCSLKTLNLGRNNIGKTGAASVIKLLRQNKTLEHLDLSYNAIGDDGAALLCAALNGICSLRTLDLEHNNIGKAGITAIGDLLKQNKTLELLDLRSNAVGDEIAALCAALKVNSSLKTLSLDYNGISDAGARGLSEALKVNYSLRELRLWGNRGISEEMKASMRKEFPGRVTFNPLDFRLTI